MTIKTKLIDVSLIFLMGIILFTIGLNHQEIISFESRFYLFALEMWKYGPSWFPTTYHQPYADYPATSTFLIYLFSKLFGGVSKFTAVLPSAIASAVTLCVTYLIGALHARRWGWYAVLFLFFTITFFTAARSISLDQFITAITAASFYLVYSGQLKNSARMVWIFPLFVLGFAFRGPLGLVIPTGVVCVFYLLEKDFKRFIIVGLTALVLLIICCLLLFTVAYQIGGHSFFQSVLNLEILGRMHDTKKVPFFFYFVESFGAYAITYPLAILVLLGMIPHFARHPETRLLKKLLAWALIILIGLSIPADKKIRYILPIAPALALICGYLFMTVRQQKFLFALRKIFVGFCFIFPMLGLIAVSVVHYYQANLNFYYYFIIVALILSQVVMIILRRNEFAIFLLAVLTFVMLTYFVIEPINQNLNRTRNFVLEVEKIRQQQNGILVFYHEGSDGLAIKYLINMPRLDQPLFIDQPEQFSQLKNNAVVIAREENIKNISQGLLFHIILRGKIGHDEVVVLSKNGGYFRDFFRQLGS